MALSPINSKPANAPPPRPAKAYGGPRSVGSLIPKLTRKVFEKFGFSLASLVTDWPAVVGPELARYTAPERLNWPRRLPEDSGKRRSGATLMLAVDAARALDVQYSAQQFLERINAHFGYAAVARLRITPSVIDDVAANCSCPPPAGESCLVRPAPEIGTIADPELRAALARLAANLQAAPVRSG